VTRARPSIALASLLAFAAGACGRDVDLGGSIDAALDATFVDAAPVASPTDCTPCLTPTECGSGSTCGLVAGDLYCAKECDFADDCGSGEKCASIDLPDAGTRKACVPPSGACPPASGVLLPDGAPAERCGALVAPDVDGGCAACSATSTDCQANGCYGGYWCDTSIRDCQRPPKTCN
jgi:hypothetical protein